jgi:hypothetical protein
VFFKAWFLDAFSKQGVKEPGCHDYCAYLPVIMAEKDAPLSMDHFKLHYINNYSGKIAKCCKPTDLFCVPEKMDFLEAHGGNTGSRADDQHGTAGSGTIGNKLPQKAIGRIGRHIVHSHGGGNQWHIIDNGAQYADEDNDDVLTANRLL